MKEIIKQFKTNILNMMRFNGLECMDIGDKEFDMVVTIDLPQVILDREEPKDPYDKFIEKVITTIPVADLELGVADFYGFIEDNYNTFMGFSKWGEWNIIPSDIDDFIEAWINELQGLCSGAGTDEIYKYLTDNWPAGKIKQDLDKIEEKVYEALCVYCENEKYCHEECTVCEKFEEAVENLKEE